MTIIVWRRPPRRLWRRRLRWCGRGRAAAEAGRRSLGRGRRYRCRAVGRRTPRRSCTAEAGRRWTVSPGKVCEVSDGSKRPPANVAASGQQVPIRGVDLVAFPHELDQDGEEHVAEFERACATLMACAVHVQVLGVHLALLVRAYTISFDRISQTYLIIDFPKTKNNPKPSSRRSFSKSLRPKREAQMLRIWVMVPMASSLQIRVNY